MEFRKMRRFRQQLPDEQSIAILQNATSGVLALLGDEDYPYAVPLSYVYIDGKIYFHSALAGHKIDAVRKCDKASFCVIAADDVHPKEFTTYYRSVIAFGRVRLLEDIEEMRAVMMKLGERYNPGDMQGLQHEMDKDFKRAAVIEFTIEHLTGKEAIELMRQRNQ